MFPQAKSRKRTVAICRGVVLILAAVIGFTGPGRAASRPGTLPELALYKGSDREKILVSEAKQEGQLVFYTSNTWMVRVAEEFGKKYSFIKVSSWRSDSKKQLKRLMEEYASGRYIVDVIETSAEAIEILHKERLLQEHYSPEMRFYGDEVMRKGKDGAYYWANREIYISLGFNTNLVAPVEAPKTIKDFLDAKWKGRMSIAGTTTGVRWTGAVLEAMGREFLEKLSRQEIKVQNISGAALAGLVVSGEVPLSPTIFDSNIFVAKRKGAPVEWRPVDPVLASVGQSGLPVKAPHAHAALLFLDYIHSKEGQQVAMKGGLSSPRTDIGSLEQKFKKVYLEAKYPIDVLEKKLDEWDRLMRSLFITKR